MISSTLSPVSAREVAHLVILSELMSGRVAQAITVKGGVNLRLFFRSARYSEDMDLDGDPSASSAIREAIVTTLEGVEFSEKMREAGVRSIDLGEGPNKDTATTFRYKFGVVVGGVRYPTKVEVSFREKHDGDESVLEQPDDTITAAYEIDPFEIRHYDREASIRQKIHALGGRSRVQARDVFDLQVLLSGSTQDGMMDRIADGVDAALVEVAYGRALEISYEVYEGQVGEFLEEDADAHCRDGRAWDELKLSVATFIEDIRDRGSNNE